MLKVFINGSSGKVGTSLSRIVNQKIDLYVNNKDISSADVVIDFTLAAITEAHAALAAQHGTKLILGTTGHDEQQLSSITAAANKTTIVKAMNFSVGINILLK